jgi:hypothetical protein
MKREKLFVGILLGIMWGMTILYFGWWFLSVTSSVTILVILRYTLVEKWLKIHVDSWDWTNDEMLFNAYLRIGVSAAHKLKLKEVK